MKRNGTRRNRHPTVWSRIKSSFGKVGTLNVVLVFVGAYMVYINFEMLKTFRLCGSAPETAWCSLIAALLGECGICGWIKTSKEKHRAKGESPEEKENNGTDDVIVEEIPVGQDGMMGGG